MVIVARRGICKLRGLKDGHAHAEDGFLAHSQVRIHPIEVLKFFWSVVDARGEDGAIILINEIVVDNLKMPIRIDEYLC